MGERIYSPEGIDIDIDGMSVPLGAFELLVLTFCLDLPYKYSDRYISVILTFWRRNYFFHFSTSCIYVRIMKQTAF